MKWFFLAHIQRIKVRKQNPSFGALFRSIAKPKSAAQLENLETY
jgi:hypothetical protein